MALPALRGPECALKWPFVTSAQLARLRSTDETNAGYAIPEPIDQQSPLN